MISELTGLLAALIIPHLPSKTGHFIGLSRVKYLFGVTMGELSNKNNHHTLDQIYKNYLIFQTVLPSAILGEQLPLMLKKAPLTRNNKLNTNCFRYIGMKVKMLYVFQRTSLANAGGNSSKI